MRHEVHLYTYKLISNLTKNTYEDQSVKVIFCGPCIIIYPYKDQQDALFTFSFIPINNLYLFRAGLLLIIRRYDSVYSAVGMSCVYVDWLLAGSERSLSNPASSQST
jgi:hypothetical protein